MGCHPIRHRGIPLVELTLPALRYIDRTRTGTADQADNSPVVGYLSPRGPRGVPSTVVGESG